MRLLALGLTIASAACAVVIDRIAITVNADLVKASDIDRDLLATQLLNGDPPNLSLAARKKDASHLIDQVFIRDEINVGAYPTASEEEAKQELDKLISDRYRVRADFDAALRRYRLTEADLREQFRWQLTVLQFIDVRFRPAVLITDEAVDKDYSQHRAQLKKQNPKGTEQDLKSAAREMLTGEAVNKLLFEWLDQHRHDAKIKYLETSLR